MLRPWIYSIAVTVIISILLGCNESTVDPSSTSVATKVFIDSMVPHNQVALAKVDQSMSMLSSKWLKDKCSELKTTQTKEVEEMKRARMSLFGSDSTPPPLDNKMDPPMGMDIDKTCMQMMIEYHQNAIIIAKRGLSAGLTPPMDALAHQIESHRTKEIIEFQDSMAVWYPTPVM